MFCIYYKNFKERDIVTLYRFFFKKKNVLFLINTFFKNVLEAKKKFYYKKNILKFLGCLLNIIYLLRIILKH